MTTQAVVYRVYDADDRLIYVGSTSSWRRRIAEHRRQSWWWSLVSRAATEGHPTLEAARAVEAIAIQEEAPVFNWRDTGREWLDRREAWNVADHSLHAAWSEERGLTPTALRPPMRYGRSAADTPGYRLELVAAPVSAPTPQRLSFAPRSRRTA